MFKFGGDAGEAAKNVLKGIQKAEEFAQGKAPEQIVEALRDLIARAKKLLASSGNKNETLNTCVEKAQALLESGDISTEAVTKLTAELTGLMKGAGESRQPAGGSTAKASPAGGAPRRAPAAPAQSAPAASRAKVEFSDVDPGAYYYAAVQWAVEQGITSGTSDTTFSPDTPCTRAQTIVFLWRAAGSPAPKSRTNPFSDIKEDAFYYDALLWAAERGIATGTAFQPDEAVTRGQVATFLYRNAGSPAVRGNDTFADVPGDSDYYLPAAWAAAKGITSGTSDTAFSPDMACTRGQIVTFLYRSR